MTKSTAMIFKGVVIADKIKGKEAMTINRTVILEDE